MWKDERLKYGLENKQSWARAQLSVIDLVYGVFALLTYVITILQGVHIREQIPLPELSPNTPMWPSLLEGPVERGRAGRARGSPAACYLLSSAHITSSSTRTLPAYAKLSVGRNFDNSG